MPDFTALNRRQMRRDQIADAARATGRVLFMLANVAAAAALLSFVPHV